MAYYGAKKVIAWHLAHEVRVGGIFTVEQIEEWVRAAMIVQHRDPARKRVEVDRRLRELREVGWVFASHLDMPGLASYQYKLIVIGKPIWAEA